MRWFLTGLAAGTLLTVLAVRQRFVIITVTGDSMMPTLEPGDRVLVRRSRITRLRPGDVAVAEMPGADGDWSMPLRGPVGQRAWMIKRVAAVPGDPVPQSCSRQAAHPAGPLVPNGKFLVIGDNTEMSHDSRHMGYLPGERLLGIAVRGIRSGRPVALDDARKLRDAVTLRGNRGHFPRSARQLPGTQPPSASDAP